MTTSKLATLRGPDLAAELRREFEQRFGQAPRLFRAPGRVNLIGEHTDYNEGWVMPAAIEFSTVVAVAPRSDHELRVASLNFHEERAFPLGGEPLPEDNWTDYVQGVALMLERSGTLVSGANMMVWGDVPLGAGLSSSASIEVATAIALLAISGAAMTRGQIARLCQRAENEFVGARCGIMDQFISANGKAGHALMLDCRSLHYELVPIPEQVSIVVANTMVKHQLSGGEYNTRRAECEEGVRLLQRGLPRVQSLRDVSATQLEKLKSELPELIYRRCRHVVSENERVAEFAEALSTGDLESAGHAMWASHHSLRDDYEVSCRELDVMVDIASTVPGTIGSRMTGGGFGGCTVSLVRNDAVEAFQGRIARQYIEATGIVPEIYVTRAADGAHEV